MQRLLDIMRTLRAPDGCPWDQEQTHESLRPYLLEEAAEAVDALASGDAAAMREELGDVLLQIAFHAVIAEETGAFSYQDIETGIVEKLVRRHPHVFGEVRVRDAAEVFRNWQAIKASEKAPAQDRSETVPRSLPALMRAQELGGKLGWPELTAAEIAPQVAALGDAPDALSLGDALLALVDLSRAQGVSAELALRDALNRRRSEA